MAMSESRWVVWKHDCANHQWLSQPCMGSEEPWQVDAPVGQVGATFPTHAEAIAYIQRAKQPK